MSNEDNEDFDADEDNEDEDEERPEVVVNHLSEDILHKLLRADETNDKRWRERKKHKRDDSRTVDGVLDLETAKLLLRFLNKGILAELGGVISTGKEAHVYLARTGDKLREKMNYSQDSVALKIYRTRTLDFKRIREYIVGDQRFRRVGSKSHQIIKSWAEKEYKNYKRCFETGHIAVPQPLLVRRNILIMQFIGDNGIAAPLLRDTTLEDYQSIYEEAISTIKRMYSEAGIVHGDLSEYNLLYYHDHVWVIDVSQAVLTSHPYALKFLIRDFENINKFFSRREVKVNSIKDMVYELCQEREDEELALYL